MPPVGECSLAILDKAHQRLIREQRAQEDRRDPLASLAGAIVRQATSEEKPLLQDLILQYEWLGNYGASRYYYGLWLDGELLGAALFGVAGSPEARDICGKEYRDKAICLMRGACVHYAPKNAASYLIRHATKAMHKDHAHTIFFAYADPEAGEIGTVYQAVGWYYLGQGVGHKGKRYYMREPGTEHWIGTKAFYARGLSLQKARNQGWEIKRTETKHKYVWFEGGKLERKGLRQLCRYPFLEYPKR